MTREEFRREYHAFRLANRTARAWRPDDYADRRDPFDRPRWPVPSLVIARVIAPVRQTLRQALIDQCKRCPPHERSVEAAVAHGVAQMREIDRQRAQPQRKAA